MSQPPLKRIISLPFMVIYGLGTMIGGGIYALVGKVAGISGMGAPIAFSISALLALLTAFSYAELTSRFPKSGGEATFVHEAFGKKWLSKLIGWMVILTGIVSASALANASKGFVLDITAIPSSVLTFIIIFALGVVAIVGVRLSVWAVTLITIIETAGLLLIIFLGRHVLTDLNPVVSQFSITPWALIFSGAFLAFYAFIGVEDMVNMAEEVKDVRKTLPVAIIISIVITLVLYMLISTVAVLLVPPAELAKSLTPMADLLKATGTSFPPITMSVISLLAVTNGALVQIVMASRVMYGMSNHGNAPKFLGSVNSKTQTPINATVLTTIVILILALFFDLTTLAKLTSGIILAVFAITNSALIYVKVTRKNDPRPSIKAPIIIPILGALSSVLMIGFALLS